jgi:hypothetical protein
MMGGRSSALLAAVGTLFAGIALDRWSSSATSADVSLALLFVAGLLFVAFVWLEARSLA